MTFTKNHENIFTRFLEISSLCIRRRRVNDTTNI